MENFQQIDGDDLGRHFHGYRQKNRRCFLLTAAALLALTTIFIVEHIRGSAAEDAGKSLGKPIDSGGANLSRIDGDLMGRLTTDVNNLGTVKARATVFDNQLAEGDVWLETTIERRLWFECLLVSETGVVQTCTATKRDFPAGSAAAGGQYDITTPMMPMAGYYHITLTLAHKGEHADDPSYIEHGVQFEGHEYRPHHVVYLRRNDSLGCMPHYAVPQSLFTPEDVLRDVKAGTLEWRRCGDSPGVQLPEAMQGRHLILVGDSHMRGWRQTLQLADGSFDALSDPLAGIVEPAATPLVTYIRTEGMESTGKESSKIPASLKGGSVHTDHQLLNLKALLDNIRRGASTNARYYEGKHITVAMNFGAWDLRDVRLEAYCARLQTLEQKIMTLGILDDNPGVGFVWRLTTTYSYGSKTFRTSDLRTNEKIARSNLCARQILRGGRWRFHDSFAFTHPMFASPCDTHHYLCPLYPGRVSVTNRVCHMRLLNGTSLAEGCAGKADFEAFIRSLDD